LIEWPEGEAEPTKYWLSTLPENVSFTQLVDLAAHFGDGERRFHSMVSACFV
jgi:SRSO17 transposase